MTDITFDGVRINPCGELHARSAKEAFPLIPDHLRYSDRNVTLFLVAIMLSIIFVGISILFVIWKKCSVQTLPARFIKSTSKVACTVILLEILCVPIMAWFVHVGLSVTNIGSYFECKGVVNGIATGDTWPVPSCFEDLTSDDDNDKFVSHCSYFHIDATLGVALIVTIPVVAGSLLVFVSHRLNHKLNDHHNSDGEDENDDEQNYNQLEEDDDESKMNDSLVCVSSCASITVFENYIRSSNVSEYSAETWQQSESSGQIWQLREQEPVDAEQSMLLLDNTEEVF
eukprot:12567267-Ditylum_brightwellii.AAC.1